jgi:hypothetical protein
MVVISRGLFTGGIGPTAWVGLGREGAGAGALVAPAQPVSRITELAAIKLVAAPGRWLPLLTVFPCKRCVQVGPAVCHTSR